MTAPKRLADFIPEEARARFAALPPETKAKLAEVLARRLVDRLNPQTAPDIFKTKAQ